MLNSYKEIIQDHSNFVLSTVIQNLEMALKSIGKAKPYGIRESGTMSGFDQLMLLEAKVKDALSLADAIKERTE